MEMIDRFDYVSGAWLFWSENHAGQSSEGYQRLSSYRFNPGPQWAGWNSLSELARNVYRAWCKRESVACVYDSARHLIESAATFELDDPCVEYFLDDCGSDYLNNTSLINLDRSDFVNAYMPYTRDLLNFYDWNEDAILYWLDQACHGYGYTSRLQLVEAETIETPDQLKTAYVNAAMTYLGRELLTACQDQST